MDIKPFPNKQAIRLKDYDYSSPGTYFVTICTENRKNLLSEIRVGTGVPTNSLVSKFVGIFKRFCNKEYGCNIWQERSYDHIIRNQEDYNEKWEYIDCNPLKWETEELFQR